MRHPPDGAPKGAAPRGWFAVLPAADLPAGDPHRFRVAGQARTLRRTASGEVRADGGAPVVEREGMLFVWVAPQAPTFALPRQDGRGWAPWTFTAMDVATDPVHVMRDLADTAHFVTVHGYANVRIVSGPTYDGPTQHLQVHFDWDTGLPGRLRELPASFRSTCHGLGYQYTATASVFGRYHTRHLVLPTPLDAHTTRVHLGVSARVAGRVGRWVPPALARAFAGFAFRRDIARDARLWEALARAPALPCTDPAIQAYRRWAARFTDEEPACSVPSARSATPLAS